MRRLFLPLFLFALAVDSLGAGANPRSIKEIPGADESLRRGVSAAVYKSLQISPVKGWVVARGQLAGNRITGSRILRSDIGGAYDRVALELAGNLRIMGDVSGGNQHGPRHVRVHLLLYDVADGRLAVSFANFEEPDTSAWRFYGGAWMAVHKADDTWTAIDLPRFSVNEQRGPRTYTLGVQQPGARRLSFLPDVGWHRRFSR